MQQNTFFYRRDTEIREKLTLSIFGPIALKRIEHGVLVSEPMFYLFQSDQIKIGGVILMVHPCLDYPLMDYSRLDYL